MHSVPFAECSRLEANRKTGEMEMGAGAEICTRTLMGQLLQSNCPTGVPIFRMLSHAFAQKSSQES